MAITATMAIYVYFLLSKFIGQIKYMLFRPYLFLWFLMSAIATITKSSSNSMNANATG